MAEQQEAVFANYKRVVPKRKGARWFKDVGLGFKTPQEAINGIYIDKKCPFTGNVSIRGRILTGVVMSAKMERTIIVRRDYLHYVKKYNRYEKRHKNVAAHCSPAFVGIQSGDVVTIALSPRLFVSMSLRFSASVTAVASSLTSSNCSVYHT
ncbi:hypothetical protein PSACC_01884, partial [Paramicrosporidium saccamoebae]